MRLFTGTWQIVRLVLRRDRILLPLFVLGFAAFALGQVVGSMGLYDNRAEREVYARATSANPALVAIIGPPFAIERVGGDVAWQIGGLGGTVVGLVSLILVCRHTRAEEQSGRGELLRSGVLGRCAQPLAVFAVVAAANVLLAGTTALTLLSSGLRAEGALTFGASMGAVGILFAALGVLLAQVAVTSSAVYGLGGVVLGLSYMLRSVGDLRDASDGDFDDGGVSWISPIGWAQRMQPFANERFWPLLLFALTSAAFLALALALASRRDFDAGLVPPRPGRPEASPLLRGTLALAFRLQRGLTGGWTLGMLVGGFAIGSIAQDAGDFVGDSPLARDLLGQTSGPGAVDAYLAAVLPIMAMVAAFYAIQSVLRMRAEEDAGRLEPVLASPVSRWRWAGAQVLVTLAGSAFVVAACGLGVGTGHALRTGDAEQIWRILGAQLASLPAVLVLAGVAVLLFGALPRAGYLAWAVLAATLFLSLFGGTLDLPGRVLDLSPFEHVPDVPAKELRVEPLVWLSACALFMFAGGIDAFRKRNLSSSGSG
ncbi:Multidrug efflux system permease protein [Rubrobacter xylanophilus DSM 9941]|uniref:ABC transporter permease n=1 Tax=Rubrobacter xylanophilus TaxID=49319 RepID=UPI001C63C396|nr:hypothetical protein [Rubrobacter xylanophilus]QYJ15062.1 Multidrug efflux system permease protein [Rubrobacter xylanophilus DSM 9941]